jgi:hypothetical protein
MPHHGKPVQLHPEARAELQKSVNLCLGGGGRSREPSAGILERQAGWTKPARLNGVLSLLAAADWQKLRPCSSGPDQKIHPFIFNNFWMVRAKFHSQFPGHNSPLSIKRVPPT